jgi:hypothetical protein
MFGVYVLHTLIITILETSGVEAISTQKITRQSVSKGIEQSKLLYIVPSNCIVVVYI